MELLDASTAEAYLRRTGRVPAAARVVVRRLEGGVSNEVLLITVDAGPSSVADDSQRFVIKQARPRLRTPQPWFCTVERIWREIEVLALCARLAEPGSVPRLLFADRDNYLFAMSAAPANHRTWKQDLLAGKTDPATAMACGRLLGQLHAGSWRQPSIAAALGDRQLFDELRIDPYYRTVAAAFPEWRPRFADLIDSMSENCVSLVHADFSPKNVLLFSSGQMLVDFETGHYGDSAFDLGFFFSHLLLKGFHHAHEPAGMIALAKAGWQAYESAVAPTIPAADWRKLEQRWPSHLGACIWSRIDGKSQVEYLPDPRTRDIVRNFSQQLLESPVGNATQILTRWQSALAKVR